MGFEGFSTKFIRLIIDLIRSRAKLKFLKNNKETKGVSTGGI